MTRKLLAVLAVCLTSTAFADGPASGVQHIRFEDVREACLNPANFHNQTAPANIQVSCRQVQTKWVEGASQGNAQAGVTHDLTSSLLSDKYVVDEATEAMPAAEQTMACPSYREVRETLETVRAVTCEELVAFQGTATEFCAATIDALRQANPAAVVETETGNVLNMCGSQARR